MEKRGKGLLYVGKLQVEKFAQGGFNDPRLLGVFWATWTTQSQTQGCAQWHLAWTLLAHEIRNEVM